MVQAGRKPRQKRAPRRNQQQRGGLRACPRHRRGVLMAPGPGRFCGGGVRGGAVRGVFLWRRVPWVFWGGVLWLVSRFRFPAGGCRALCAAARGLLWASRCPLGSPSRSCAAWVRLALARLGRAGGSSAFRLVPFTSSRLARCPPWLRAPLVRAGLLPGPRPGRAGRASLWGCPVVAFVGSRSLSPSVFAASVLLVLRAVAAAGLRVAVSCCRSGVPAFVRSAAPGALVFSVVAPAFARVPGRAVAHHVPGHPASW